MNRVKGMRKAALRIEAARAQPFDSVEDLARRAALDAHDIDVLAAADALLSLAGHRRRRAGMRAMRPCRWHGVICCTARRRRNTLELPGRRSARTLPPITPAWACR
jgi:error-prone DNA polymerase